MSYKTSLIKMAIKCTPKVLILWVANTQLKGIAELADFNFDLDARKSYVQIKLFGEAEAIEVWLEDFAVVGEGESYQFIIEKAQSNRPWLANALARVVGTAWKIPVTPQTKPHLELVAELFKTESPKQEAQP
ncbi:MAG: hypothetical protein Q7U57_01580 [Methylovulum sp.]|nr:hypothetical protein [Methylovulum sp.]